MEHLTTNNYFVVETMYGLDVYNDQEQEEYLGELPGRTLGDFLDEDEQYDDEELEKTIEDELDLLS